MRAAALSQKRSPPWPGAGSKFVAANVQECADGHRWNSRSRTRSLLSPPQSFGDVCRAIIPQRRDGVEGGKRDGDRQGEGILCGIRAQGRYGIPRIWRYGWLAAQAVGCEPARIARRCRLPWATGWRSWCAGDARIANPVQAQFGCKAYASRRRAEGASVAVGGVCPFAVNGGCDVCLDESLRRFDVVYPACGSSSAIALTLDRLAAYTPGSIWVDKLPGKVRRIAPATARRLAEPFPQ